jgi:BlaI family transcriptional regulator, penicillinase repressor
MRPRKTNFQPTDAEIEILNILWKTGPATVRLVHEELSETKPSRYTTTLKLMQIMAAKKLLERDDSERSHVYRPAVHQELTQRKMATDLMQRAFTGSLRSLVLGALGGRRASKKEIAELRELIEEHESGSSNANSGKGRAR